MKIKNPPKIDFSDAINDIVTNHTHQLGRYLELNNIIDNHGRYIPFDKFQYRIDKELDPKLVWALVKNVRIDKSVPLFFLGDEKQIASFVLTPYIQNSII